MRTHVVLPEDLVKAVDALAGKGKRSRFIEDAVREKLRSEALLSALEQTAGVLPVDKYPEWSDREQVASWVRETRQQSDTRLDGHRSG